MATAQTLVESFPKKNNTRQLANWKRSCTTYCKSKHKETGTAPSRFLAAVKMRLTKNNLDVSVLENYKV